MQVRTDRQRKKERVLNMINNRKQTRYIISTTDSETEPDQTESQTESNSDSDTKVKDTESAIIKFKDLQNQINNLEKQVDYFKNRCTLKTMELDRFKGLRRSVKTYVIAHDFQTYNDKEHKFREFCDLCDSIGDHKEDCYYKPEIKWPNEEYQFGDHEIHQFFDRMKNQLNDLNDII